MVAVALIACATPQTDALLRAGAAPALPERVELDGVPLFPQRENECGPAALASVLHWSGDQTTPDALAPEVLVPARGGTLQAGLLAAARRHGRVAYRLDGLAELLGEVAAGHPVLVHENLGLPFPGFRFWHYSVVVGYDLERGTISLHSGSRAPRLAWLRVFERTWRRSHGWALVVLPPSMLPARPDESRYLEAAVGLAHAERWTEAEAAYDAAVARWPRSPEAWLGLASARRALGDRAGAEQALRNAADLP